jgi:hypothetical protein
MAKLFNLARMTTATIGTGTITLGAATSGFLSFATAGVVDADIVAYGIKDGANSEVGTGTYTAAGTTLTRNVTSSTNGNAAISLSGSAEVFITTRAQDILRQPVPPGGRLTLSSGNPALTDVSGASTVFYSPYKGNYVPLYDGSSFSHFEFNELSQTTSDTTKSPAAVVGEAVYDVFVWNDAGTLRATRGPAWTKASTVTMTIATPAVITWTAHGLNEGDPIVFTNSGGALPTGITAGTIYYVSRSPAANTFNVSTTVANTALGTLVNTSGSQSGTHTGTNRTRDRGTGGGTSELVRVKGIWLNTNAISNGPGAQRGTYVGSIKSTSGATITFRYGSTAPARSIMGVWNCYNRIQAGMRIEDGGSGYNYSGVVTRQCHAEVENRIEFLVGLSEDAVYAYQTIEVVTAAVAGAFTLFFPNVDTTSGANITGSPAAGAFGGALGFIAPPTANAFTTIGNCHQSGLVSIGWHFLAPCEVGDGTNSNSFNGNGNNSINALLML